jgi:hypothetical protein
VDNATGNIYPQKQQRRGGEKELGWGWACRGDGKLEQMVNKVAARDGRYPALNLNRYSEAAHWTRVGRIANRPIARTNLHAALWLCGCLWR